MARFVENPEEGSINQYPDTPDVKQAASNLLKRGYSSQQIADTVANNPVNPQFGAALVSEAQTQEQANIPQAAPTVIDTPQPEEAPAISADVQETLPSVVAETQNSVTEAVQQAKSSITPYTQTTNRGTLDTINDLSLDLGKGVVSILETGYELVNLGFKNAQQLTTKPSEFLYRMKQGENPVNILRDPSFVMNNDLGNASAVRKLADNVRERIDEFRSDAGKRNVKNASELISTHSQIFDEDLKTKTDSNGNNSWWDIVQSESVKAVDVMSVYMDHPETLTSTAVESGLQFIVPASAAGVYTKVATKAGKESAEAIARNAENISAATIGLMEGTSTAGDAVERVRETSLEDLARTSDLYNSLLKDGVKPEDARELVAQNVGDSIVALNTLGAGLISKLTGAAKLEGNLFTQAGTSLLNLPVKALIGGAKEGLEEGAQSGIGTLSDNLFTSLAADRSVKLHEGLGESVGIGLITGVTSGTAMSGAGAIAQTATGSNPVSYLADLNKLKNGEAADVTNPENSNYSPYKAISALLDSRVLTAERLQDEDKKKEHLDQVGVHVKRLQDIWRNQIERYENATPKDKAAEAEKLNKLTDEFQEVNSVWKQYNEYLKEGDVAKAKEVFGNLEIADETTINNTLKILGSSPDSFSEEYLNTLAENELLNDDQVSNIEAIKEYKAASKKYLSERKDTATVNANVVVGGVGYVGTRQYLDAISNALSRNDTTNAQKSYNDLVAFADRHKAKLDLATRTFNAVVNNEPNAKALQDEFTEKYSSEGTAYIEINSARMIGNMRSEVDVMNKALEAAESQFKLTETEIAPVSTSEPVLPETNTTEALSTESQPEIAGEEELDAGNIAESEFESEITKSVDITEKQVTKTLKDNKLPFVDVKSTMREFKTALQDYASTLDISANPTKAVRKAVREFKNGFSDFVSGTVRKSAPTNFYRLGARAANIAINKINIIPTRVLESSAAVAARFTAKRSTALAHIVRDFYKKVLNDPESIEGITAEDLPALRVFRRFHRNMSKHVDATLENVLNVNGENFKNFGLSGFVNENNYNEVKDAVTTSAFEYLGNTAGKVINDDSAIASLVGIEEEEVTSAHRKVYRELGDTSRNVFETVGANVLRQLGISPKKDMTKLEYERIRIALGQAAIEALNKAAIVERISLPNSVAVDLGIGLPNGASIEEKTDFIRLARTRKNNKPELHSTTNYFIDNFALYGERYNRIFGYEVNTPSFTVPKVPELVKRVGTKIPRKLRNTLRKHSKRTLTKKSSFDSFTKLSEQTQEKLIGVVLGDGLSELHAVERDNIEGSTNVQLRRDLKNSLLWGEISEGRDFYVGHEVWSNFRMGISNSYVNIQGSKVARGLFGYSDHNDVIDSNGARLYFKMAVLQSFGEKIERMSVADIESKFDSFIADPQIESAIQAVQDIESGKFDTKDDDVKADYESLIVDVIERGGENLATYHALVALTKYDDTNAFPTDLALEVDGITNGVLLSVLQFGGYGSNSTNVTLDDIRSGGVFSDGTTGYAEFIKQNGARDFYEKLAVQWDQMVSLELQGVNEDIQKGLAFFNDSMVDSLTDIVTSFGRKIAKAPTMVFVYGSGMQGIIDDFLENELLKLYQRMAKINDESDFDTFVDHLNLLGIDTSNLTYQNRREVLFLDEAQVKASFQPYAAALNNALTSTFDTLLERRNTITGLSNIATSMFQVMYNSALAKRKKALGLGKNDLLSDEDQTKLFEDLVKYSPTVNTYLSDGLSDGMRIFKLSREYTNSVATLDLGKNPSRKLYVQPDGSLAPANTTFKSLNSKIPTMGIELPGASAVVKLVHQLDAGIMERVLRNYTVLNVHDAIYVKPSEAADATQTLNYATALLSQDYSIVDEIVGMYDRVEKGFLRIATKQQDSKIRKTRKGKLKKAILSRYAVQNDVTRNRSEIFSQVTNWDQYSLYGGSVNVHDISDLQELEYTTETTDITEDLETILNKVLSVDSKYLKSSSDVFGSFSPDESTTITKNTSERLLNDLIKMDNTISSEQENHLRTVLREIVNEVLVPTQVEIENQSQKNIGQYHTELNRIDLKLTNSSVSVGNAAASEVYVHELIHAVTQLAIENNKKLYDHLYSIYESARKVITVDMLAGPNATQQEKDQAQQIWNYVFANTVSVNGVNASLHEFMAYSLTNEKFRNGLKNVKVTGNTRVKRNRSTYRGKYNSSFLRQLDGVFEFVWEVFKDILQALAQKRLDVHKTSADVAMFALAKHFAEIEVKSTNKLSQYSKYMDKANKAVVDTISNFIVSPLTNLGKKVDSNTRVLRTVAEAVRVTSRAKDITYAGTAEAMKSLASYMRLTEDSLARAMANELSGATKSRRGWNRLMRLSHLIVDQARTKQKTEVQRVINDKFYTELSKEEKRAFYNVGLRLDLSSLLPETDVTKELSDTEYNKSKAERENALKRILRLLEDEGYLRDEISRIHSEISAQTTAKHAKHIIEYSDSLGLDIATGAINTENHAMNAHVIVNAYNNTTLSPNGDLELLEKLSDELATLRGIEYAAQEDKKVFVDSFYKELSAAERNYDDNGFMFSLQMHNYFKRESLDKLFNGNKIQVAKGYMREETDPYVDMIFVKKHAIPFMEKEGYVLHNKAAYDARDINQAQYYIMTRDTLSIEPWMKTTVSFTGKRAMGTRLVDKYRLDTDAVVSVIEANNDNEQISREIAKRQQKGKYYRSDAALRPIFTPSGKISGYRYVMNHESRERILKLNTDFDAALGRLSGSILDKVNSEMINREVVKEAKSQYDKAYKTDATNFVWIGPEVRNPKHRELWHQIPDDMKKAVEDIWGVERFAVNKDDFTKIFGFRKFALADWAQNQLEIEQSMRDFKGVIHESILRALAGHTSRRIGRGLQELTTMAKDSIVIKTFDVLLGNVVSNMIILLTEGMNPLRAGKWAIEGWKYAEQYQDNQAEIVDLENEINSSPNLTAQEIRTKQAQVARLKNNMRTNPVHDLVERGVFQTIVEDLDFEDSRYTYLSKLQDKVAPATDYVPDAVKDLSSLVFMTHDTKMYKTLRNFTQLSDFAGRYALHKHNMEMNNMSVEDSVDMIMDTFVDYDSPTHRSIQYMNDIGLFMFTKFFLRIQKVIFRQALNKPVNTVLLMLLQQLLQINTSNIFGTFAGDPDNWMNRVMTPVDNIENVVNLHGLGINVLR